MRLLFVAGIYMTEKLFSDINDNYKMIIENIQKTGRAESVRVMAVTKTVDVQWINEAISCGIDLIGENRVQEFLEKRPDYSDNCEVHFIGGLQTNKVKQIVGKVTMIHSVDSLRLASEINRCAGEVQDVLIEVNIAGEQSKHGVSPEELSELVGAIAELRNVRVRGLMAIPPWGEGRKYFEKMQKLYSNYSQFDTLSMGMSGDYIEAIECGATIVRLGSVLFGSRL
jgi:hypothetical protein